MAADSGTAARSGDGSTAPSADLDGRAMEQVGGQSRQAPIKFLKIPETRALKRHLSTFTPEALAAGFYYLYGL
jgi:hypothetical protein